MTRRKSVPKDNNIKALRKARGWTQDELGKKVGLTKGYISKLEDGATMTRDVTEALSAVFCVPIESLYKNPSRVDTDINS